MKKINLFGQATKSRSSNATAQSRVNMYLETSEDKNAIIGYGMPGLDLIAYLGDTPIRGLYQLGDYIYVVHRSIFYRINNAGVSENKGTLLSTVGKVSISDNGTQIMIVDGTYGYIYTIATGVLAQITDADFPGADTVSFNDGFFIVNKPNTGQFYLSASYNGAAWDALDFATAESNPDNLKRVYVDHGTLILFGENTTEFWVNSGSLDFPYTRLSESTIEWGIAAIWSVAKFDNSIIFLGKNRMGEVQVIQLQGNSPIKVSTNDIDTIINGYTSISDAVAFSYLYNGHPFYQINFNTQGESWLYDGLMQTWSKLRSWGITRHRSELCINYIDNIYTTDYLNGYIYKINKDTYTENGELIELEFVGKHINNNLDKFTINQFVLDIDAGVGEQVGSATNPQIMLSVSRDNGHTWSAERWANMGKVGQYYVRAMWNRLGAGRDFLFKIRVTDAVKRVIMGAYIK